MVHPCCIKLVWRLPEFAFFVRELRLTHFFIFWRQYEKISNFMQIKTNFVMGDFFGMLNSWNLFPIRKFLAIDGSLWAIYVLLMLLEMKLINIGKIDISDKRKNLR